MKESTPRKRQARTFSAIPETESPYQKRERLLELIDTDYKTFQLQYQATHPTFCETLARLIDELNELKSDYKCD